MKNCKKKEEEKNYTNPFEYGKSFPDKLFPERFGTLTQTKP